MSELETILIVDDNPENRALLAGLLKPPLSPASGGEWGAGSGDLP